MLPCPRCIAGGVTALTFDLTSTYLVSSGDKHIQVLHNVVGHRATLVDLAEREKKAMTHALRERIQQQMEVTRYVSRFSSYLFSNELVLPIKKWPLCVFTNVSHTRKLKL